MIFLLTSQVKLISHTLDRNVNKSYFSTSTVLLIDESNETSLELNDIPQTTSDNNELVSQIDDPNIESNLTSSDISSDTSSIDGSLAEQEPLGSLLTPEDPYTEDLLADILKECKTREEAERYFEVKKESIEKGHQEDIEDLDDEEEAKIWEDAHKERLEKLENQKNDVMDCDAFGTDLHAIAIDMEEGLTDDSELEDDDDDHDFDDDDDDDESGGDNSDGGSSMDVSIADVQEMDIDSPNRNDRDYNALIDNVNYNLEVISDVFELFLNHF